jgi:hypothetical protein
VLLVAMALVSGAASAQDRAFPSALVRIEVRVDGRTARVRQHYALTGPLDILAVEYLDNGCARVGPVTATLGEQVVTLDELQPGVWVRLQGRLAPPDRDEGSLILRYEVQLAGPLHEIPIVLPAASLARAPDARGAAVDVSVVAAEGSPPFTVTLPRLERVASNRWSERLLAMPSTVHLSYATGAAEVCEPPPPGPGGLVWRFWVFVATMGLWVPIYFWWFSRRSVA